MAADRIREYVIYPGDSYRGRSGESVKVTPFPSIPAWEWGDPVQAPPPPDVTVFVRYFPVCYAARWEHFLEREFPQPIDGEFEGTPAEACKQDISR